MLSFPGRAVRCRDLTVVASICDVMGNNICIEAGVQSFWIGKWQDFDQWGLCREEYEKEQAAKIAAKSQAASG